MWRLLSVEKWQRGLRTTKKRRKRCRRGEEGKSHQRRRPGAERVKGALDLWLWYFGPLLVFPAACNPFYLIFCGNTEVNQPGGTHGLRHPQPALRPIPPKGALNWG